MAWSTVVSSKHLNTTYQPIIPYWTKGKPENTSNTPEKNSDTAEQTPEKQPARYRCCGCKSAVGFVSDEIKVGDLPSLTAQVNPYGFVHEVITILFVQNSFLHGQPTPADSWFPGYLWLYSSCKSCGSHLGWAYFRPNTSTYSFVGLRRSAVYIDDGSSKA